MKKTIILLGFVFIASFSAYTLTSHSEKTLNNAKTEDFRSDSTKCKNDSTHMKHKDAACCKKDESSCCKKK